MADYQRQQKRFAVTGIKLNCALDDVPDDKLAIGTNVRPTQQGTLTTRPSITSVLTPSSSAIHSLKSFNAVGINRTFSGAGTNLSMDAAQVDTGYSGGPLTWAAYQPSEAVQPFLYVGDSIRYSKVRATDGVRFGVGVAPPGVSPSAELAAPLYSVVNDFESTSGWTAAGAAASPASVARVPTSTTTAAVLYDSGTAGWACVAFSTSSTSWLAKGARIIVNAEAQIIAQMVPAALASTTTIAALHYDSGATGLCCVVLTTNTRSLERNALLQLNAEYVRVLSVAIGEDNTVSFRCSTTGTHASGETVTAFDTARMYFAGTHTSGETVTGNALVAAVTLQGSPGGTVNATGTAVTWVSGNTFVTDGSWAGLVVALNGVDYVIASVADSTHLVLTTSAGALAGASYSINISSVGTLTNTISLDLSQISGRPVTADDWLHISVAMDNPENLLLMQILLDVDATTNDFTRNYYWAEITANALQAASTGDQTVLSAQQTAVTQQATQAQILLLQAQYNQIPYEYQTTGGAGLAAQIAALESQIGSGSIAPGSQLATGASAWSEIFIPISTLLTNRTGTDASRTLADVEAIRILVSVTGSLNIAVDSWWIGGAYGPNAPESIYPDNPMKYCFRYRSTITGAQSTWGPLTRGGLFPERQSVSLSGPGSTDAQVDTVDIARVGASVNGTPQELASIPNASTWTYTDNYTDAELEDQIEQVDFQPWPIQQNPIKGTCSVVGTSVFATSVGVPANLCVGTLVTINGTTTTIRGAPATVINVSSFQVTDNLVTGTALPFQIENPTTSGNPLPYLAGPFDETIFAAGDPINPGRIYFCNRGNPETANTSNFIDLTSSAEPLYGVTTWNAYVVAMTQDRFFAGTTSGNAQTPYSFAETSTGQGLLVPWCFDVGPVIFFLSKSGIMATDLGAAQSLSKDDLYPFLPHEGQAGISVNGYSPPALSPVPRLSFCKNGWVYFDYQTASGGPATLALNTLSPGWWIDTYTPGVSIHAQSESPSTIAVLLGCVDGSVQTYASQAADSGGAINCQARIGAQTLGDMRSRKQWGDAFADCDASLTTGIVVTMLADNWSVTLATATLVGARSVNRIPLDVSSGHGSYNVNAALNFAWSGQATLYGYELAALARPVRTQLRTTDWIDLGQSIYLQGLRVTTNTGGVPRNVLVEYDGSPISGGQFALTMNHNGDLQLPYSFAPVIAHRIRLTPTDAGETWELFNVEPIGPKAPEAVTIWQPQPTSHGAQGYQSVREIRPVVQGIAAGTCVIAASCEFGSFSLSVTLTGAVEKLYRPCPTNKGMIYGWSITGGPVRVFEDEFEIVAKQWASSERYRVVRPFGESGTEGAVI